MIDTSDLKDGDKCYIWTVHTCPCGCESEGNPTRRTAIFQNGVFQAVRTYEVYGSSVIRYKKIVEKKRTRGKK